MSEKSIQKYILKNPCHYQNSQAIENWHGYRSSVTTNNFKHCYSIVPFSYLTSSWVASTLSYSKRIVFSMWLLTNIIWSKVVGHFCTIRFLHEDYIEEILSAIFHSNIKYSNKIFFLDVLIFRNNDNIQITVNQKSTHNDVDLYWDSFGSETWKRNVFGIKYCRMDQVKDNI